MPDLERLLAQYLIYAFGPEAGDRRMLAGCAER